MFYALAFDGICIILFYLDYYDVYKCRFDSIFYQGIDHQFDIIPSHSSCTYFYSFSRVDYETHRGCSSKHRRFNREALLHYITDVIDDSLAGYNEIPRTFLLGPYVQAPSLGVLGCSWWEHGLRSWGVSRIYLSPLKIPKHKMERFESVLRILISYESSKSSLWKWHKISKNTLQHSYGLC